MPIAWSIVDDLPPTVSNTVSAPWPFVESSSAWTGSPSEIASTTSAAFASIAIANGSGLVPTITTCPAPYALASWPRVMPIAPVPITTTVESGPTGIRFNAWTPHA